MANEGIAKWFGLRRPNFLINPREDVECYAPRRDIDISSIVESLEVDIATETASKRLFWGLYGGGKTHTLFKVAKELEKLVSIHTIYVECPNVGKKSTFIDLYHDGIMASMGQEFTLRLFEEFFNKVFIEVAQLKDVPDRHAELVRRLMEKIDNEELARAILMLSVPDASKKRLFWRYISGVSIPPRDLSDFDLSQDISESKPATLAEIIIIMGKILRKLRNKTLLLVFDELDRLGVIVDVSAISTFQTAFRKLLGVEQNEVAILMGCSAADLQRDLPEVFGLAGERAGLGPVLGKLGKDSTVPIQSIDPKDFVIFVKEIIRYIRDPQVDVNQRISKIEPQIQETLDVELFPFTKEALEALKGALGGFITPMEITKRMTQAMGKAYLMKKLVVTREMIGGQR